MRGKNKRRKAAIVVTGICAVFLALSALAFCFNDFSHLRKDENNIFAAEYNAGKGNLTITDPGSEYKIKFDKGPVGEDPYYYVEIAGANGGGGKYIDSNGYGGTIFGFYKGTSANGRVSGYRGSNVWNGGGFSYANLNVFTRTGGTGNAYAGGGGGYPSGSSYDFTYYMWDWLYYKSDNPSFDYVTSDTYIKKSSLAVSQKSGAHAATFGYDANKQVNGTSGETPSSVDFTNGALHPGEGGNGAHGGKAGSVEYTVPGVDVHHDAWSGVSPHTVVEWDEKWYYYRYKSTVQIGTQSGSGAPIYEDRYYFRNDKRVRYYKNLGYGEGGSSSDHAYWKGNYDNGAGYVSYVRLTPSSYPSENIYDYDGAEHTFNDGNTAGSMCSGRVTTRYAYKDADNSNAAWTTEKPTRKDPGISNIDWQYQILVDGNVVGAAASGRVRIIVRATGDAGTLSPSNRTFTGEYQQLVTGGPSGASSGATIYYYVTGSATYYTKQDANRWVERNSSDGCAWSTSYSGFKFRNAGTYYVHWYAGATTYGNTQSKVKWTTVTINKANASWSKHTLAGLNPTYNGSSQSLFSGSPSITVKGNNGSSNINVADDASVSYVLGNNTTDLSSTYTSNSDIAKLQIKDVTDNDFYLWAKLNSTTNLNGTNWFKVGPTSRIQIATIAADGIAIASPQTRDYTGRETMFITGTPTTNQETKIPLSQTADVGQVTYTRNFTPADEMGKPSPAVQVIQSSKLADVNAAKDAGRYELVVSWTGSRNVKSGSTHFQYYTVNKTDHGIDLGRALNLVNNPTISSTGTQLVTGGWLETVMDGNSLTNTVDAIDGVNNWVSFYWSQDGDNKPNLDDPDVANAFERQGPIGTALGTSDLTLLYNYRARLSGTWYLWIKFDHHCNIKEDTMVRYYNSVLINVLPAAEVHFEGINGGLRHNENTPFDGLPHEIAKGDLLYGESSFITIDENDVQYNICDANGQIIGGYTDGSGQRYDGWTKNKADLRVTTFGTYFLVIRWGWSNDGGEYHHVNVGVTEETGIRLYYITNYEPFCIVTKTNFDDLTFEGLTLNQNSGKEFDNTAMLYTLASPENSLEFFINNQRLKNEYKDYFGIINYALTTDPNIKPASTDYYANIPSATNVGRYYLYLTWTGTHNIANGTKAYDLTKYLEIIPATKKNIVIDNIIPLTTTERTYTGQPIPLFGYASKTTPNPIFWVKDFAGGHDENGELLYHRFELMGGNFQFALISSSKDEAPAIGDSEWKATLAEAKQSRVNWKEGSDRGDFNNVIGYNLWVRVFGDHNLEDSIYKVGFAKLEMKESYVDQAPTAKPRLSYIEGTAQILINGSPQDVEAQAGTKPCVEYMLYRSGSDPVWVRDTENEAINLKNTIKATDPGIYYVYYRGGNDDNHITQRPDEKNQDTRGQGYPYIVVQITPAHIEMAIYPESLSTVYNGKPQTFFAKGYAEIPGNNRIELLYSVHNEPFTVESLNKAIGGSAANVVTAENFYDKLDEYLNDQKLYFEYSEVENLMRTNAGTYTVYFKATYHSGVGEGNNPVQATQIEIGRTRISPQGLDFLETTDNPNIPELYKQYRADDYQLILSQLIFALNGTNNITNLSEINGNVGLVEYGIAKFDPYTMSTIPEPTTAVADFRSVAARDAGIYYLYYRVWAGDNHLGTGDAAVGVEPSWICFNSGMPVYIAQADSSVVDLSWSSESFGPAVRYNGQPRTLVTEGELVQRIEGRLVTDKIGRIWYALRKTPDSPGAISGEWKTSYLSATQIDAGNYYLHVKVEASANLTELIGCVNRGNPVVLGKATADDLSISGISVYNQMYNGAPLSLATGDLQVNTVNAQKVLVTPNVVPGVAGFFQYTTYNNRKPSINWPTEQGLAAATNAIETGSYYLWVKIPESDNVEESIVLVNSTAAKITPANEENIYIVIPTLAEGLEYNGRNQKLIIGEAGVALRSGNALTGTRGDAYYYVKQDSSIPRADADGWTQRYDEITAKDRGIYYVFVKFVANAGSNHTDLKPVLAGQIDISRAGANTLRVSGILYNEPQTFNGTSRQIAYGEIIINIEIGGELVPADGVGTIRYAWSNDSRIYPNIADSEWEQSLNALTAVNAGEYYLWIWVGGGDNIASFRTCLGMDALHNEFMLIKQASADVVTLSGIAPSADHLVYNGAPQQLAKGDLVQKIAGNTVTSGYVAYGLGFGPNKGQEPLIWYSSLDMVMATNATVNGEPYYLWVRVDESANIATKMECICRITIDRAQATVTGITGAEKLYYYQGDQCLLSNPGVANFGEVVYRLEDAGNVHNASDWLSDWHDVVGQNAGKYTVYYAVIDNPNWVYCSGTLDVWINPSTAHFLTKPTALTYLTYNEKEQDLIDFGQLLPESGTQGCKILFRYKDGDPNVWYEYYDHNNATEIEDMEYGWGAIGKLPGRSATGTYTILYYTTGGTTGNFIDESSQDGFTPHELTVTMERRGIIWLARPTPRRGLKNTGEEQVLLTAGQLSAPNVLGGTIEYSMDKDNPNSWSTDLPRGKGDKIIFECWYRVRFDPTNNYFVDGDVIYDEDDADAVTGIVYSKPELIEVLMEKLTLSFLSEPRGVTITYDATEQPLVAGGELSTFDLEGVNSVYINYSLDQENWLGQDPETHKSILPTASAIGSYTIYYRVEYDPAVFEFTGKTSGYVESTVLAAVIEGNEIRATITIDESKNYTIGFDRGSYSDEFGTELGEVISYRFRRRDQYFTDDAWHPWSEFDKNKIGTYEIQALIEPKDNTNFTTYEQSDNFETFVIAKDLSVNIDIREKSKQPLLQVWVDLTGGMTYENSPFKLEYNPLDKDRIVLHGVNSPGNGGQGVIRVRCVNDRYYYLSETLVSDDQKTNKDAANYINLNAGNTDKFALAINPGLDAINDHYTVFIYEVYKISYDANTGIGSLPNAWKWHDVAYELAENNFEKQGLIADGWSKYPSGSGERFRKGAMFYLDNMSQVFYAQYAGENEKTVVIRWKVGNYEISSDGVWFNANATENQNRPKGITCFMNGQVYLPDISGIPEDVTNGRRIAGWHMEPPDESVHYYWGFIANREEIVFIADFNDYGTDYINVVFTSDGTVVRTNTIANGADSYMALSGVGAGDFKKYDYQKFVDEYKNKILKVSNDDRVITYDLGPAKAEEKPPVIEEPTDNKKEGDNNGATVTMVVIIIIGLVISAVGLTVYLLLRSNKLKMKIKRFKEDKSV